MCLNTERIRTRREELGLTQQQAADLSDLGSKQAWNNVEHGRDENVTLERLSRIAAALKLHPRELIK